MLLFYSIVLNSLCIHRGLSAFIFNNIYSVVMPGLHYTRKLYKARLSCAETKHGVSKEEMKRAFKTVHTIQSSPLSRNGKAKVSVTAR